MARDDSRRYHIDTRCCTHSHCVIYTAHPSGLCAGHRAPPPCPDIPHGDDIGDDVTGRRYLYCANCGREYWGEQHTATRRPPDQADQAAPKSRPMIDLSDPAVLADPSALIVRILTVPLVTMIQGYGATAVLEAMADAFTELARIEGQDREDGGSTGTLAALVVLIEQARVYAIERGI